MLNSREYNLLRFLLDETEPEDPFAESPSRQIPFSELVESPYVKSAYRAVTERTFRRELVRLVDVGFIAFSVRHGSEELFIELDFGAIEKYGAHL